MADQDYKPYDEVTEVSKKQSTLEDAAKYIYEKLPEPFRAVIKSAFESTSDARKRVEGNTTPTSGTK